MSEEPFEEKMEAFLGVHQRIVAEFGRSLSNARHFLKLAGLSMEKEPEETQTMLEQIREIDLLGHLTGQFEEYNSVAGVLLSPESSVNDEQLLTRLAEVNQKYQALVEEAEGQMEEIQEMLSQMQYH